MTLPPSLETISQARHKLAKELSLEPAELVYNGIQEGLGYDLAVFTVNCPGNDLHRTSRSVRLPL